MRRANVYRAGLDVGSTTAKMALLDHSGALVWSDYRRHHARIYETLHSFFNQIVKQVGDCLLDIKLTGSAALGVSKRLGLPFVQEVIAAHEVIRDRYPEVRTAMDIGGEDAKVIFFTPGRPPDIRMNGSCAGGTGSFIDQMATLLNIPPSGFNDLARAHDHIYPVASRCGVFAKTDVQNMLSRGVPHKDIAASVFRAVAVQCINSLARGIPIRPKMLLCGGVFTFLPELVKTFSRVLHFSSSDLIVPDNAQLFPAVGAALYQKHRVDPVGTGRLLERLTRQLSETTESRDRLEPLFPSASAFEQWEKATGTVRIHTCPMSAYPDSDCFLGIDSGSTTTKIIVIGKSKEVLFSWYGNNHGTPIRTVIQGLSEFRERRDQQNPGLEICRCAVTGYGEDLIKAALNMDLGVVETMAHYTAARFVDPKVSFILDIGGQDMKAVFVDQGVIHRIELNEACSSGCGSFLEALAGSLNHSVRGFARLACQATAPCDLGTRCTVFMNSKIKQSLRENAAIEDISAGLSYAVIRNCLFKVLKLHSMSEMGDHIVLQGGTFKNPSIVRALELLSKKRVTVSDMPELMGAFGAALLALEAFQKNPGAGTGFPDSADIDRVHTARTHQVTCRGCENACRVTRFVFPNGQVFFSGNKCEKYYSAKGGRVDPGFDFTAYKNDLMFNRVLTPHEHPVATLGIPRCLNTFDHFVFWHTLLTECGINIVLSSPSTAGMAEKGMGTVMSDNICFPAKLVHSHIWDLAEKKPDRIFYPVVMYAENSFDKALNAYNCPIVSGYADVIESSVQPEKRFGIPLDRPVITFSDRGLLKNNCRAYLRRFAIDARTVDRSFEAALAEQERFRRQIRIRAADLIAHSRENQSLLIVLAGRPYHADGLVNHKIPEILSGLGVDVITEDAVPVKPDALDEVRVVTQWSYPNRIYSAARWVAESPGHVQMVQINSFGCGPDAIVVDEVREILKTGRKNHTLIRVDEISSPGSVRLRLRSMVASLKLKQHGENQTPIERKPFPRFLKEDRRRTILAPFFSEDYSPFLPALFKQAGYRFQTLPRPDRASVDLGLQYANNDICYPGTIVIGDIVKALQSDRYDQSEIAVGITQTGGQCRASNYLALIRKAMINAGYEDVPLISVTMSQGLVDQPGFQINWLPRLRFLLVATMLADCIAKMYYATAPREQNQGQSQAVRQHYIEKAVPIVERQDIQGLYRLLEKAVADFNRVPVRSGDCPRMGIVGEIYAKYNYFCNQDLVHWLIRQGIEPVIPPIIDYFIQDLVNYKENIKAGIRRRKVTDFLGVPIEWSLSACHDKINGLFKQFRHGLPFEDIRDIARKAGNILTLTHQFGEGWLIPGEIAGFAEQGIHHVISVQPFGCIANHIVSKGVENRIRSIYPELNLYFLDFDPGMSEANIRNRLHFMVEHL